LSVRCLARRKQGTAPSREPAASASTYEHPAYDKADVRLVRGGLVWEWRNERVPLQHPHYDTFTRSSEVVGDAEGTFPLDRIGAVKRFHVNGHLGVDFARGNAR
jgi:hypothetical protein